MLPRARPGPALSAFFLLLLLLASSARPALAWVDVNVERDDVRVSIDRGGSARVEHRITLKIAGGPLRALDIRGADRDAVPDPDGYVVPEREASKGTLTSAVATTTELLPPDLKPQADGSPAPPVLRVRLGEKGLGRGVYVVLVRYTTRLGGRVTADGGLSRVEWRGPIWSDGLDSARVTFDLPAAPTEPRAADPSPRQNDAEPADPRAVAPLVLSTVRRGTAKDEIELMRPYVPKGEAITWAIRVDARALAPPAASASRASREASSDLQTPLHRIAAIASAAAIFLLFTLLVALKSREVARAARATGTLPRPLVPLSTALRAPLAGLALAAGVGLQIGLGRATLGAILVVIAAALAAHLTPRWKRASQLRGPGRWLPVAEAEAFRDPPRPAGYLFDVSTRAGKAILAIVLLAIGAAAFALHTASPWQAAILALDATAILAVFCTGRLAELPPDPAAAPARFLRAVARRLRKSLPHARVVGRIRVPDGGTAPDELRLAVAPKSAPRGFVSVEVGVVYARGAGAPLAIPGVLLRMKEGSVCDSALEHLASGARVARGRKPGERVLTFSPRLPTARMTAALVFSLVKAVTTAAAAAPESRAPSVRPARAA